MLTDAEMQRLLDEREKHNFRARPSTGNALIQYLLALDAALPWMVEEVRRLRAKVKEWNEYTGVLGDSDEEEESNG